MGYIDSDTGRYVPNPYLNPHTNRHNRKHRHHINYNNYGFSLEQKLMILISLLVFIGIIIVIINIKY